jgi:hypothetical protein
MRGVPVDEWSVGRIVVTTYTRLKQLFILIILQWRKTCHNSFFKRTCLNLSFFFSAKRQMFKTSDLEDGLRHVFKFGSKRQYSNNFPPTMADVVRYTYMYCICSLLFRSKTSTWMLFLSVRRRGESLLRYYIDCLLHGADRWPVSTHTFTLSYALQ